MLKVTMRMVKPGQEQRLRDWLSELMQRQDEVRETFKQETVRHELGYLLHTSEGMMLIYVVEAEDLEQASEAYRNSNLPIDTEHKKVMQQVLGDPVPAELIYDCALE
jgi:hypothetical protein